MSIRFECPSCSKSIVTPSRFQGRSMRCPGCDIALTVPKQSIVHSQPQPEPEESSTELVPVLEDHDEENLVEVEALGDSEAVDVEAIDSDDDFVQVEAIQLPKTELKESFLDEPPAPKGKSRSHRGDHDEGEEDLEWDITPMVDVAFLLLIFFMLTASFSIQKVIRTKPPQSNEASSNSTQTQTEDPAEKLIIQVDEFSAFTVISPNGGTQEASSRQELINVLKDMRILYEDQPPQVIIQAHEDSTHGAVVNCMDAAREADFAKFQLAVVEEFD